MASLFNPVTPENSGYYVEKKIKPIAANKILCAGGGSFLLGKALKLVGQRKIGSFIGSWALPLLVVGGYRKITDSLDSEGNKGAL